MSSRRLRNIAFLVGGLALVGLSGTARAATLVLEGATRYTAAPPSPGFNLSPQGTIDWAYWSYGSGAELTPPVAPTNDKVGGTAIGSLGVVGGGKLRGSTTATTVGRYAFSDGSTTPSGSSAPLEGLIFNSLLATNGKGIELSVAGDPTTERLVTLYLGGFNAVGNLSLSLAGVAAPVTDATETYGGSDPKQITAYRVRFKPDSSGDALLVRYTASEAGGNGHVGMEAVTVSAVPEPGVLSAAAFAGLLLARSRRRRPA